jgi:hypothetical protein
MLDLTWVTPVITSIEGILGLFSQPPLSYYIGLMLTGGVVSLIRSLIGGRR